MKQDSTLYVGLDLGDRYSRLCVLDGAGEVIEEARVRTSTPGLGRWFSPKAPMRVALEVGTHSGWVSRLLSSIGHEVFVANARKLRAIYANDTKTDRGDAEMLARLVRVDPRLLHPLSHRSERSQAHLALLRAREAVVETRTKLVNHVRGSVKAWGGRLCKVNAERFHALSDALPDALVGALEPLMEILGELSAQIARYDGEIERLCVETYPVTELLRQVPRVGAQTALTFVLTVEDPFRFESNRRVGSYLGLRPRKDESGDRDPQLRITKAGDRRLRRLLVQCAHGMLQARAPDTDLKRWGLGLAARGGARAKKRAAVAVARKLSVLLVRLWKNGEVYEPLHQARRLEAVAA